MQRGVIAFSVSFSQRVKSFVVMAMVAVATLCFVACGSDDVDNGENTGGSSVTVSGNREINVTSAGGEVVVSFNTSASYTLSVDNTDMVSIKSGATGSAGQNRATLVISENKTQGERWAEVSITVSGYPKQKIFDIVQSYKVEVDNRDEVLKWVDKRLREEYYWLDIYSEAADGGKIDYELSKNYQNQGYSNPYSEFLDRTLLSLKGNEQDGSSDASGNHVSIYTNISRVSTASSSTRAASQTKGFGVVIQTVLWLKQNPNVYAFPIQHVYPDSPAAAAGLKRGDVIYEIDGSALGDSNYSNAWYSLNVGSSGTMNVGYREVISDKAEMKSVTLSVGSYYPNPIACSKVLELSEELNPSGKKIGYMSYLSFDADYDNDLVSSMNALVAQGAQEMILDLRLNGGGSVNSSILLASMMLGEDQVGGVYAYLRRHKDNPYGDDTCHIIKDNPSTNQDLPNLGISRLWVITTGNTASASEMVIQGLRGLDIPVHVVGTKTEGKNCGMDVMEKSYGSYLYTFAPITFMNFNAKEFNDYADGIEADTNFDEWIADPKKDADGNTMKNEAGEVMYDYKVEGHNLQMMINRFPLPMSDWGMAVDDGENPFDVALHEAIMQINDKTALMAPKQESASTRAFAPRYVKWVDKFEPEFKRTGGGSLYYGLQKRLQSESEQE